MKNQIKIGSLIAYINIFINMTISVFLTPFIIRSLGASEYGVYKIISSFSAQLGIITFGIASLVARNVVFYNTKNQKTEKENFLFMAELESFLLAILIIVVGLILYSSIDLLYAKSLTIEELALGKKLFWYLVINVAVTILCDSFTGTIRAHEKFVVGNLITTLRYILRLAALIILLKSGIGSIGIVLTDLFISILVLLVSVFYSKIILKEHAKFHYFDKKLFTTGLIFSFAVFLQAVINQFNNNLDNIVLGSLKGSAVVAVYSVGLMIFAMFTSFVTVLAQMYGPGATKLVAKGANGEELTEYAIKPARIQTMLALLIIVGFALIGKDFVFLWLGDGYSDVYIITLILLIPAVLPLVESITNTILDAMLKRLARSVILLIMCGINLGVTILLIKVIGYIGAAVGTAISLIIGHGIIMNIYLHKKIGLNIPRLLKGTFKGILLCAIITVIAGQVVVFLPVGWGWLILKAVIITLVYSFLMFIFGFNANEKNSIKGFLNRMLSRVQKLNKRKNL